MLAREISLVKKEKRYVLVSRSVVDMEEAITKQEVILFLYFTVFFSLSLPVTYTLVCT